MMETISVLLVFLILLTFVIVFYVNISQSTAGVRSDELADLKSIEITQLISFMPEFQCSFKNIVEENCFDILKIQAFQSYTLSDPEGQEAFSTDYFDLFEYSHIVVYEIFPDNSRVWEIYYREPNQELYDSSTSFVPINLYNPITNEYTYGVLNVTVFS